MKMKDIGPMRWSAVVSLAPHWIRQYQSLKLGITLINLMLRKNQNEILLAFLIMFKCLLYKKLMAFFLMRK